MLGATCMVVFVLCVAGAGAFLAAATRLTTLYAFLLTAYLGVWVQVVVAGLVLTALGAVSRVGYLAFGCVSILATAGVWHQLGRPRPDAVRLRLEWFGAALRDPPLGLLAAGIVATYTYLIAVGIAIPQNDWDPLTYELSRAALWRQEGGVSIIDATTELRLNVNPVAAELGQLATMVLTSGERFVWLVQLPAAGALSIGAFGLARRLGLTGRQSLFASLLVPTVPIVVGQAVTAYNDLLLASFVLSAAVFGLGKERRELFPLSLAVALAVATKFTAPLLLPLALAIALTGQRRRRWPELVAAWAAGVVVGAGWHVVNLVRRGSLDGGLAEQASQQAPDDLGGIAFNAQRLVLRALELPGTHGDGALVISAVGLACVVLTAPATILRRPGARSILFAGGILMVLPQLVHWVAWPVLEGTFSALWKPFNDRSSQLILASSVSKDADGSLSWAGPLALGGAAASGVIAVRGALRRNWSPAMAVAAVAPFLVIAVLSASISYDPWRGRFLAAAWVMSISTWGLLYRYRTIAWLFALTSLTVMALSVLQWTSRPVGFDALARRPIASIWSLDRWQAQTVLRRHSNRDAGQALMFRRVEERVPRDAELAVALRENDYLFPYFGADLERRVEVIDDSTPVPDVSEWLVAAPEAAPIACVSAWSSVVSDRSGWRIYRRTAPERCMRKARLASRTERRVP
jgi:hypothetical protein